VKDKKARQTEPPLHLDMEFGEALRRFVQTKPEEVEPPSGKKPKVARAAKKPVAVAKEKSPPAERAS